MPDRRVWTLNRLVALVLVGGFVMLAIEIRSDHRDVLGEQPLSWTPIIFSLAMIPVGLAGVGWWRRGGRQMLEVGFMLAIAVGLAGFYLHNAEHPVRRVERLLGAWSAPIHKGEGRGDGEAREAAPPAGRQGSSGGEEGGGEEGAPNAPPGRGRPGGESPDDAARPVLAPLAFVGLGALGVLACLPGLQQNPGAGTP